jgi:hypothetical protein
MKTIKETFVIVNQVESYFGYFQNYISFDKEEIDLKCQQLNKEANDNFKKHRKKTKLPFIPSVFFIVLDLEEALVKFSDDIIEYYREGDASD